MPLLLFDTRAAWSAPFSLVRIVFLGFFLVKKRIVGGVDRRAKKKRHGESPPARSARSHALGP